MSRDTDIFKNTIIICALRGHKQLKRVPLSAWQSAVCTSGAGGSPQHTAVVQLPETPTFSSSPALDLIHSLSCERGFKQSGRKRGQVCLENSPCRSCSDLHSTPGKQNWCKVLLLQEGHISEQLCSSSREP